MQSETKRANLSIDDNGGTNGNKGGHCVKAEWDAKKRPTHLKSPQNQTSSKLNQLKIKSAQSNQLKYGRTT